METYDLWKEILDYAIWAPSPHNVQPWKVKLLSETEAELFYDPSRLLPIEDPQSRFLLCGFGIFLEMIDIAANDIGYKMAFNSSNLHLDIKGKTLLSLGKMTLQRTDQRENLDRELIKKRRTSRLPYLNKLIPTEVQNELRALALQFNHKLSITTDTKIVQWIIELNKNTMFYDMEDKDTREEIDHWIRYSFKQATSTKDGLWALCMNVPAFLMTIFFKARWIVNLPIISQILQKYYIHSTSTSTVAWLQGPFQTPEQWLKSGQMLARLWLTLTKYDIYLHPFGSIITNPKSHKELSEKFKLNESQNLTWLIMRIGYSSEPPRSLRLTIQDIII